MYNTNITSRLLPGIPQYTLNKLAEKYWKLAQMLVDVLVLIVMMMTILYLQIGECPSCCSRMLPRKTAEDYVVVWLDDWRWLHE